MKKIVIFLGGMSESGKSFSGDFLTKNFNFKRLKIIDIEKELMIEYNIPIGKSVSEFSNSLELLYSQKNIFQAFYNKIIEKSENCDVSLESLYRSKLFLEIQKLYPNTFCIFFDAKKENRLLREFQKRIIKEQLNFEEFQRGFLGKEKFKLKHGAHLVEDVATITINNDGTKQQLERKISNYVFSIRKNLKR